MRIERGCFDLLGISFDVVSLYVVGIFSFCNFHIDIHVLYIQSVMIVF